MLDKKFKDLMRKTHAAGVKHKKLLAELEEEYFVRYGYYPCDVDDDFFIDSFDYCQGNLPSLEDVQKSANIFSERLRS